MPQKQVEIIVSGLVQDVNFRYYTRELAQKLGLVGWVRNENDGTVKIVAEGEERKLRELVKWAKTGPQFARVKDVKVNWQESKGLFEEFSIEY